MAVDKSVDDVQYDDDGKPIVVPTKADDEGDESKSDTKADTTTDTDKGEEEVEDKAKNPDFDDTATPVIPIRKSNTQFIIARKDAKIKKLESQKDKDEDPSEDTLDGEEDDNLSEDAKKAIDRAMDTKIKPLQDILVSKANEEELKDLFSGSPEAKKYENHIKAYLQHDAYKNVPPEVIYHHLAFGSALSLGAKKKTVADKEAGQSKGGGRGLPPKNSVGDLPSAEDIAGMSEEEFEAMETDARQGKFIKK